MTRDLAQSSGRQIIHNLVSRSKILADLIYTCLPDALRGEVVEIHRFHTVGINGYMEGELDLDVIAPSLANQIEHTCIRDIEWGKVGVR